MLWHIRKHRVIYTAYIQTRRQCIHLPTLILWITLQQVWIHDIAYFNFNKCSFIGWYSLKLSCNQLTKYYFFIFFCGLFFLTQTFSKWFYQLQFSSINRIFLSTSTLSAFDMTSNLGCYPRIRCFTSTTSLFTIYVSTIIYNLNINKIACRDTGLNIWIKPQQIRIQLTYFLFNLRYTLCISASNFHGFDFLFVSAISVSKVSKTVFSIFSYKK